MTGLPTIAHWQQGSLLVTVHSHYEPSDPEWDNYLSVLVQHRRRHGMSAQGVTWALGGVANASQRARLVREVGPRPVSVAILTSAPLVRGVVTALSWFNPAMRCFAPAHVDEALRYLQRDPGEKEMVARLMRMLCRQLHAPCPQWA